MKLSKAIEIIEVRTRTRPLLGSHEIYGALQLSIEALRECKKAREGDPALDGELLPGETPEDEGE